MASDSPGAGAEAGAEPAVETLVGQTLENYRVLKLLGSGDMGDAYLGEHVATGTKATIKVLRPEVSRDEEAMQRFFDDARSAAGARHPGLMAVYDVGFLADGRGYLVRELFTGESLRARLVRLRSFSVGQAAEIAFHVAAALASAHSAGVVHRDVKPENLFLVPAPELGEHSERVKIADFGVSRLRHALVAGVPLEGTVPVRGTSRYMAPEQGDGDVEVDSRADTYALGCVLYEMLTGRHPFALETSLEITQMRRDAPLVPPSSMQPVPPELDALVMAMLAKDRRQRPSSMADVVKALVLHAGLSLDTAELQPASQLVALADLTDTRRGLRIAPPRPKSAAAAATAGWAVGGIALVLVAVSLLFVFKKRRAMSAEEAASGGGGQAAADEDQGCGEEPPSAAKGAGAVGAAAGLDAVPPPSAKVAAARWVLIMPPDAPVFLGVSSGSTPVALRGFRPGRLAFSPTAPYELQQREVTQVEVVDWQKRKRQPLLAPPSWAGRGVDLVNFPATGVAWGVASAYCADLGGALPTEEQWEYAARGPYRRSWPWGTAPREGDATRAWEAVPQPVLASEEDLTPDDPPIHDLGGNAMEWTADVWRADLPGADEAWVTAEGRVHRAVRGAPLGERAPSVENFEGAAWRTPVCAEGACPKETARTLRFVGFRCVRTPER